MRWIGMLGAILVWMLGFVGFYAPEQQISVEVSRADTGQIILQHTKIFKPEDKESAFTGLTYRVVIRRESVR